jgi:hypothetical protein
MARLGPKLIECSERYNDAEHAASMRVAVCIERMVGYENWTKSVYVKPWRSGIHPSAPEVTIGYGNTWDPPGSFHQVSPPAMHVLKRGHIVEVEDGFYDFAGYAFRSIPLELTYRRTWQLHFGYWVSNFGTHTQRLYTTSSLVTRDGGKTFAQEYEGNLTIVVTCDPEAGIDIVRVDQIERGPNITVHLAFDCPDKQPYYK